MPRTLTILSDTSIRPTVAAGRECDVTTHAVSRNAGYGLLKIQQRVDWLQIQYFGKFGGFVGSRPNLRLLILIRLNYL